MKMKIVSINSLLITFFAFLIFIPVTSVYAQTDSTDYVIEAEIIPYDEMLNLLVEVVSKKAQSISEAPAIVSIITDQQIEQLGIQKLHELLEFVPGFTVQEAYWKKLNTARGVAQSLYNDKILMLINGVPAYDACNMEYFLDLVPLTAIKRVEIIRGPGSTLYGTNAFAAVINIVTKNETTNEKIMANLTFGSFRNTGAGVSISDDVGDVSYYLAGTFTDDDGYIKENFTDEIGVVGDNVYEYDIANFFGSAKYYGFSVNTGYMYTTRTIFGPVPRFNSANNNNLGTGGRRNDEKLFLNLFYEKELSEKVHAKLTFHYDYTDKQIDLGSTGVWLYQNVLGLIDTTISPDYYRMKGWLMMGEAQLSYQLSDDISLMGGVTYEQRTTENLADLFSDLNGNLLFSGSTLEEGAVNNNIEVSDVGGYLQIDGKLGNLGYVAGIRATYLGISEEMNITPRVGLVYNFSKSSSVKALYGEAFRGAGPQEQYYKVPGIIFGLDAIGRGLKPEKIRSFELALDQELFERYKVRVNAFLLNVFDIIARRNSTDADRAINPLLGNAKIYDNLGEQQISGVEVELNGYPTDNISFFLNFSYKDGSVYDDAGTEIQDYITYMENVTASGGMSFRFGKVKIAPNFQYVGAREGTLSSDHDVLLTVDSFALFNLVAEYKFDSSLKLSLSARNLFDKEYWYPEAARRNILELPGGPGRAIYAKMTYTLNK